jgi:hypothetical protein
MTDRPIIFSAPMVRALLDGRKTQTRRVLKPQPGDGAAHFRSGTGKHVWDWPGLGLGTDPGKELPRVPYAPGDRLWVREAWRPDPNGPSTTGAIELFYPADRMLHAETPADGWRMPKQAQRGKVTPLHMPRWASRLTLHVTEVRVQRLQEISEADIAAEGIKRGFAGGPHGEEGLYEDFADLWNRLHGPDAWDANPWVCAISFTVQRGNIDAARPRPKEKRRDRHS